MFKVRISKAEKVVLLGITQTDERVENYTAVLCVRARRGCEAGIHFISHSFINPHLWLQERVNKGEESRGGVDAAGQKQ